ncbi:MAG: hypothetical protein RR553_07315 [Akkermansia sp.]
MDSPYKTKNGILYFIIIVLVASLGTCIFFLMKDNNTKTTASDFKDDKNVFQTDKATQTNTGESSDILCPKKEGQSGSKSIDEKDEKEKSNPEVSSTMQKMTQAVSGYFASKTPKERLAYVISPKSVEPLMKTFYQRKPMKIGKLTKMKAPVGMALNGVAFWRAQGQLEDGTPVFVAMKMIEGTPKIDWQSEVRYCSFDWDKWLDDPKAPQGDFRVYAKIDGIYSAPFTNSDRYRCLQLKTMDSSRTIFGYLDLKDFDQQEFFQTMRGANGGSVECLLTLEKIPAQKDKPATARVVKVISPSWIDTSAYSNQ